jgi:opacity protein-like surface antigen
MKYPFFILLTMVGFSSAAQNKISFEGQLEAGTVFSRSKPIVRKSPGYVIFDPNTGGTTYMPGKVSSNNNYKNLPSAQFELGVKASYKIGQDFKIYSGLSFSYLEAKRRNTVVVPNMFPVDTSFAFVTNESLKLWSVAIPLGVTYRYKKWFLDVGIIQSILLNSKLTEQKESSVYPPEITVAYPWMMNSSIPPPSSQNKAKSYLSLSFSPQYQINSRLKVGLEYTYGVSNAYAADKYSADYYQSMKTNTLGLKILYALK